ncbi:P-loop containing nucleoside triphosphate hydrolase protein [Paraphoma chrysanthemicola]|nr:P-loop containing nucleoside triphosphate hydrolase protein [Paraphoma chrysanthemicola]
MPYFFPTVAASLLKNRIARRVVSIGGILVVGLQLSQGQWGLFEHVVPSIEISHTQETYPAVLDWATYKFGNARKLRAVPNDHSRQERLGANESHDQSYKRGYKLFYEPFGGRFWFRRRGHLFYLERTETAGTLFGQGKEEKITLGVIHWSSEPVKTLIQEIIDADWEEGARNTPVHYPRDPTRLPGTWKEFSSRRSRNLDSVVLDAEKKKSLLEDLNAFHEPGASKYYAKRHIPYRRGVLFHGPPGTGKTSLAMAIAAEYRLPIYVIPLSDGGITDYSFPMFLRTLPERCLLLLEDIDSAGIVSAEEAKPMRSADPGQSGGVLTRTGFINGLDGVTTPEGFVSIMTTNHLEKLDPAMIRAGRVDFTLEISLATKDDARQMFINMYGSSPELDKMAELFKNAIPENSFSAADLQNFMMVNKDPAQAAREVGVWVEARRTSKEVS